MGLPPIYFDIIDPVVPRGTILKLKESLSFGVSWLVQRHNDDCYCTEPGFFPKIELTKDMHLVFMDSVISHVGVSKDVVVLWNNQFCAVCLRDLQIVYDD